MTKVKESRLKIPNNLLDYIVRQKLSGREHDILLMIYRCTYGLGQEWTNGFFYKLIQEGFITHQVYRNYFIQLLKKDLIVKNNISDFKLNTNIYGQYLTDFVSYIPMDIINKLFKSQLSGYEYDIIYLIMRYTYGYNQEWTHETYTTARYDIIPRDSAYFKILKQLITKHIVLKDTVSYKGIQGRKNTLRINPNIDEWILNS